MVIEEDPEAKLCLSTTEGFVLVSIVQEMTTSLQTFVNCISGNYQAVVFVDASDALGGIQHRTIHCLLGETESSQALCLFKETERLY